MNKTFIIILVVIVAAVAGFYALSPDSFKGVVSKLKEAGKTIDLIPEEPKIIEDEQFVIPNTQKINAIEGGMASKITEITVQTPIMPKTESEQIIVSKAVLTVKGSYNLVLSEAQKWSADAKPAFVKSLGAIQLDGKSSQWQVAFSAKSKPKKGYEIIIHGDSIVSKKEVDSIAVGANFPENLKDSAEAILVLQELPQFSDATISAISLSYNTDGNAWYYALTTSRGLTSIKAQ